MTSITSPRQRGAIGKPVLAIAAAAVVVGGTIWFLRDGDTAEPAVVDTRTDAAIKPAPKRPAPKERRVPEALNLPEVSEDATNAMMGSAFKYRDRMGVVHYKHRDIFEGIRGNGAPVEWTVDTRIYPAKAPVLTRSAMTNYTKKVTAAPAMELKDGKLVPSPGQHHEGTMTPGKKKKQKQQ
jgi:hypothetical protein